MHVCSSDQIRGQAWMNETINHSFESRQQKYLWKTVWADSKFLEPFRSIFVSHRHEISSLDAKVKQIRLIFANPRRWWELGGPSEPYRRHQGQGRVWGRRLHLSVWEREKNAASETFGYNLIIFYFWKFSASLPLRHYCVVIFFCYNCRNKCQFTRLSEA